MARLVLIARMAIYPCITLYKYLPSWAVKVTPLPTIDRYPWGWTAEEVSTCWLHEFIFHISSITIYTWKIKENTTKRNKAGYQLIEFQWHVLRTIPVWNSSHAYENKRGEWFFWIRKKSRNRKQSSLYVNMLKWEEERVQFQPEEFCTKMIKHCSVFEEDLIIDQLSFGGRFIRDERVASSCADATHVLLVSGHLNITFISPVGWPAKNKWFISFFERQRAFDHRTYSWQCSTLVGL